MIHALYDIFMHSAGVTTDTRRCGAGMMFFALKGASFNGNAFAAQALETGCTVAVIDEEEYKTDARCILVPDVLKTLQQLASIHRTHMGERGLRVLQITGTNGKTTTKELCAAVLSRKYNVLYTEGNLNNHIGVPLTLLRLTSEHKIAVIETGANHPGEIEALTAIVKPDMGLITNCGRAHLEGFGSYEGVKRTKGELYDYLSSNGKVAFINTEDEVLMEMAADRDLQIMPYIGGEAEEGNLFLNVRTGRSCIETHLVGAFNLPNALAALTVGMYFGVEAEQCDAALHEYIPTNNRSQLVKTERNTLIVDAYNANESSMTLAVENFKAVTVSEGRSKMVILGDMRELGTESATAHRKITDLLRDSDIETVWLVGNEFQKINSSYRTFNNVDEVKDAIAAENIAQRTILIKASNGTKLWQLPELL